MNSINLNEFTVNLGERKVTHRSGVVISFDSFETEADWLQDDCAKMRNPDLYNGDALELGAAAKRAAIRLGMKSQKP